MILEIRRDEDCVHEYSVLNTTIVNEVIRGRDEMYSRAKFHFLMLPWSAILSILSKIVYY